MLKPGDVFLERFEIEEVLGKGGFASVFKARQTKLGRRVAIKILRLDDELAQKRFVLEARMIARLRDPATVTMHDFGEAAGYHYMVLELVEGRTLREVIDLEGPFSPQRAVDIVRQVVGSLVEAHDHGILHRDIKPDNIMLFDHYDQKDRVKVLDFGIAKLTAAGGTMGNSGPLTSDGQRVGTPRYMAPETLRGEEATDAADIFSLGMLGYEMLVGERYVRSSDLVEVVEAQLNDTPILLPEDSNIPPELAALINHMLVKSPNDRVATARDVAKSLHELPAAAPSSIIFDPDEMAQLRALLAQSVSEDADTIADVPQPLVTPRPAGVALGVRPVTPDETVPQLEPAGRIRWTPESQIDATPVDVGIAVASLKADAEIAIAKREQPRDLPTEQNIAESIEAPGEPSRRGKRVERRPPSSGPIQLAERPVQRGPKVERNWRDYIGFVVLALAVFFAAGYFSGAVAVKSVIYNGEPLECGFGEKSIVTERRFVAFGLEVFKVDEDRRCTNPW